MAVTNALAYNTVVLVTVVKKLLNRPIENSANSSRTFYEVTTPLFTFNRQNQWSHIE